MTSPRYEIAADAYYKVFYHAAKHPHKPVNGVLLGTQATPTDVVKITDTVPLLHHWTSLSPMMEIGLDLAIQYAASIEVKVVGYYQACERLDETALAPVGELVAAKIKSNFADAIAFVLDGQNLGSGEAALLPFLPSGSGSNWRPAPSNPSPFSPASRFQLASADIPSKAVGLVRDNNLHFAFGDFDDHLEDVTIDWLRNRACLP